MVFDQVREAEVLLLADWLFQGNGVLTDPLELAHSFDRELRPGGDLLDRRLTAELLGQLPLGAHDLVDRLDHVDWDSDRAGLVCDGPCDGLADPPSGVRGELEAAAIVEFLDRAHQSEIAFLDEVQERHPSIAITLRDRDHQSQVRLDEEILGLQAFVDRPFGRSALLEGNLVKGP